MSDYRKRLGSYGENLAAEFLKRRGCRIIGRNYAAAYGEIDLIAALGDEILFVEVKTRADNSHGYPELAVDWHKMRHLNSAAQAYLAASGWRGSWRIDIVSVEIDRERKTAKFRWFDDIRSE